MKSCHERLINRRTNNSPHNEPPLGHLSNGPESHVSQHNWKAPRFNSRSVSRNKRIPVLSISFPTFLVNSFRAVKKPIEIQPTAIGNRRGGITRAARVAFGICKDTCRTVSHSVASGCTFEARPAGKCSRSPGYSSSSHLREGLYGFRETSSSTPATTTTLFHTRYLGL